MQYRPAKIYPETLDLSVKKWYVFYSFIHPFTGKFERFKVYEDINLFKGEEKVNYAKNLRDAVNLSLQNGYSPYDEEEKLNLWVEETSKQAAAEAAGDRSRFTMVQGVNLFLAEKKEQGKSKSTMSAYTTTANFIKSWLNENGMLLVPAANITAVQLLTILKDEATKNNWENKTYNNYLLYTETILNWLAEKKNGRIIPENPIKGADQREVVENKPSTYTDQELNDMLALVRSANDVYMEGIIMTCYYAAVRSKEEMRAFKIKNILFDRDLLLLCPEGTKARREDYVPLDPILKRFFLAQKLDKLPLEWYVFGKGDRPGPVPASSNHYATKYRPYREKLKIDESKKLYNWKHTRGIHLANAGVDPYAIMQLFRHASLEQTMQYLRDLGCVINRKAVENSREI
ncbi:site-specific integrase [Chitinophaga lutea]|uniref:Site-specific integrase n=1 Tax=Chitinophaga lutea TaxID=2488634 RepID=A0A3N4PDS7_9BACT|nr:site-specific integrase [Chitinophaga lutea]RPE05578.1 site-specific integrase [Chitinophaga lutea]